MFARRRRARVLIAEVCRALLLLAVVGVCAGGAYRRFVVLQQGDAARGAVEGADSLARAYLRAAADVSAGGAARHVLKRGGGAAEGPPPPLGTAAQQDKKVLGASIPLDIGDEPTPLTPPQSVPAQTEGDPDARMRIVWSTDCRDYQNWQSAMLLHSASAVGQKGHFVRIVSGCKDEAERARALRQTKHDLASFETHFAPPARPDSYPQQNRPDGLIDWLKNSIDPPNDGDLVVVLDPDMSFIKPLSNRPENLDWAKPVRIAHDQNESLVASPGHPVAQGYAIGPFSVYSEVCNDFFGGNASTEGCQREAAKDKTYQWRYYSIGAPYLLSAGDWRALAPLWSELTPPVWKAARKRGHGGLLADMYAFSMAAAHLGMRFTRLESFMISDPHMAPVKHDRDVWSDAVEGWELVDGPIISAAEGTAGHLTHPCRNPRHTPIRSRDPKAPLPVLLHFCQSYRVPVDESDGIVRSGALNWRNFGWSKYRAQDKTNLECSAPLLMEPWAPNDGIDVLAADRNDRRAAAPGLRANPVEGRESLLMCQAILFFNEAARAYKQRLCSGEYNVSKQWAMSHV